MAVTNRDLYESLEKLRKELEQDDRAIRGEIKELESKVDKTYTRVIEFIPVRRVVYGMVAVILTSFMAAVMVAIGWSVR